ncbi:MAG: hypothetical protein WDW38_002743 [Sanguina aurantia]
MESICAAAMEKGTALQLLRIMQRLEPSMDPAAVCHIYCMALTVQASSKPHQGHRGMACMAVSDSAALAVQAVTESSAFTASLQLALHRSQSAPLSKQLQTEFQRWWMALALLQRSMPDSSSEIADVQGRFGAGVLAAALHNLVLLADAAAGFDTAGGAQVLLHGSMPFTAMCGAMSCIKLNTHSLKEAASSVEEHVALAAKRCKAAVRAMGKAGQHVQAMAASAHYITQLFQIAGDDMSLYAPLIELHAKSRQQLLLTPAEQHASAPAPEPEPPQTHAASTGAATRRSRVKADSAGPPPPTGAGKQGAGRGTKQQQQQQQQQTLILAADNANTQSGSAVETLTETLLEHIQSPAAKPLPNSASDWAGEQPTRTAGSHGRSILEVIDIIAYEEVRCYSVTGHFTGQQPGLGAAEDAAGAHPSCSQRGVAELVMAAFGSHTHTQHNAVTRARTLLLQSLLSQPSDATTLVLNGKSSTAQAGELARLTMAMALLESSLASFGAGSTLSEACHGEQAKLQQVLCPAASPLPIALLSAIRLAGSSGAQIAELLDLVSASWSSMSPHAMLSPSSEETATAFAACAAAVTAAAAALGSRYSHLLLLVRGHCHQLACSHHRQAGRVVQAFVHSQEALRIAGMLFTLSRSNSIPSSTQSNSTSAGVTAESTLVSEADQECGQLDDSNCQPNPAEGDVCAEKSAGDATSATNPGTDNASGSSRSSGSSSSSGSRQRQLLPQLHTPVLLLYLSALYQAGVVYELSGCAEDAIAALKECSRLSLPTSPTTHALAVCLLCRISRKQGDTCRAARYLEKAVPSCPRAGLEPSKIQSHISAMICVESGDLAIRSSRSTAAADHYARGLAALLAAGQLSAHLPGHEAHALMGQAGSRQQTVSDPNPSKLKDNGIPTPHQDHPAASDWRAVALRSRLERRLAGCATRDGDHDTAQRKLQQVLALLGCPVDQLLGGGHQRLSDSASSVTAALTALSLGTSLPTNFSKDQASSSLPPAALALCTGLDLPEQSTGSLSTKPGSRRMALSSTRWPLECAAALHQLAQCLLLQQGAATDQTRPATAMDLAGSAWLNGSLHRDHISEDAEVFIVGMQNQSRGGDDCSSGGVASRLGAQFASMALGGSADGVCADEAGITAPVEEDAGEQSGGKRAGTRKKPSKAKPSANAVPQPETFLPEQLNPDSTSSRGLWPAVSGHCPRDTTDTALLLLINAAVLAWESPLLLQRSLRQVADITAAAGCCHAAAMFLHLSMATSVTTQQATPPLSIPLVQALAAAFLKAGSPVKGAQAIQPVSQPLLQSTSRTLRSMANEPDSCRMAALEESACAWLDGVLLQAPDCCICSLTVNTAGRLVLCRLSRGHTPLLVILPPPPPPLGDDHPPANVGVGPDTPSELRASHASDGPTQGRTQSARDVTQAAKTPAAGSASATARPAKTPAAAAAAAAEAPYAVPETPMPGTPPVRGSAAAAAAAASKRASGVDRLLQQMQQLLSDSSISMKQDGEGVHSQESKLLWWRARVALDRRMEALLTAMDSDWLGPWRCLLLPLDPASHSSACEAAARVANEHLPSHRPSQQQTSPHTRLRASCDAPSHHGQSENTPHRDSVLALVAAHLGLGLSAAELPLILSTLLASTSGVHPSSVPAASVRALTRSVHAAAASVGALSDVRQAERLLSQSAAVTHGNMHTAAATPACSSMPVVGVAHGVSSHRDSVRSSNRRALPQVSHDSAVACQGKDALVAADAGSSSSSRATHVRASSKAVKPGRLAFMTSDTGLPTASDEQLSDLQPSTAPKRSQRSAAARGAQPTVLQDQQEPVVTAAASRRSNSRTGASCRTQHSVSLTDTDVDVHTVGQQDQLDATAGTATVTGVGAAKPVRSSRRTVATAATANSAVPMDASLLSEQVHVGQLLSSTYADDALSMGTPVRCMLNPSTPAPAADADVAGKSRIPTGLHSDEDDDTVSADARQHAQPLLLLLDARLHGLPWESMPSLRRAEVYRMPSLLLACSAVHTQTQTLHRTGGGQQCLAESAPPGGSEGQSANQSCVTHCVGERSCAGEDRGVVGAQQLGEQSRGDARSIEMSNTFYLLNPAGDLVDTQRTFEGRFTEEFGWQGCSGQALEARQLMAAMQAHDMFVFCGHGSNEHSLPLAAMRRLHRCSANVLMGCSSGRLRQQGQYEPAGAVMGYIAAGCPCVVANLWDVTDKDIDRFCQALLLQWHENRGTEIAELEDDLVTADLSMAEPKRASVLFGAAVPQSRSACRLPFLIGAAPVVYGIPTPVSWQGLQSDVASAPS